MPHNVQNGSNLGNGTSGKNHSITTNRKARAMTKRIMFAVFTGSGEELVKIISASLFTLMV